LKGKEVDDVEAAEVKKEVKKVIKPRKTEE
jgi:hypothetical protein